jgi:hypothetical protein
VLELDSHLKSKQIFFMAWKFGAPPTTMYTPKIEANWGLKHRGGGGWYLDMPKGTIRYDDASLHNEYVAKQTMNDVGGALIKVLPHDNLEQKIYIISQVTLAQTILALMVGPKGCKSKRFKIKEVDTNVKNFLLVPMAILCKQGFLFRQWFHLQVFPSKHMSPI